MVSTILQEPSPSSTKPCVLPCLKFLSSLRLGKFGIILVENPTSKMTTSVKFIFPSKSTKKEENTIFTECQSASTLNHDNIVRITTVTKEQFNKTQLETFFENLPEDDKRSISFRELCARKVKRYKTVESICIEVVGDSLRNWLNLGHYKTEESVQILQMEICRGIVNGLAYLHEKQVIHRDLKPENVMFSKSIFLLPMKLGRFHFCRFLQPNKDKMVISTVTSPGDYIAPDTLTNSYSFEGDLFSLGLIIWEVAHLIEFRNRENVFFQLIYNKSEDYGELFKNRGTDIVRKLVDLRRQNKMERAQTMREAVMTFESWSKGYVVRTMTKIGIFAYIK